MTSHRATLAIALAAGLAAPSAAQLADLQPGRNFPTDTQAFGTSTSENVDVGDIDNDGDLDVAVANGGDDGNQANRLYLNMGGLQGGVPSAFTDVTGVRFAGVPDDTSRDVELVDLDGDFDLDVFVANTGTLAAGGQVSRSYVNLGGAQGGAIGFFTEGTDGFWGDLVSVPPADEDGLQDGQGPFREFSCDCDFADLDDDGALDLFHSSYGPSLNGTRDSRIFLNDGAGTFDELWPWADPAADIKMHALDVSLVDLDDDLDLDVFVTSRNSQSRLFRNTLAEDGWATSPFVDGTQAGLIDTGATVLGTSTWESAYGDLDDDGDIDFWVVNYAWSPTHIGDRILRNDGGMLFSRHADLHKGDPGTDEEDVDLLDYDSDGDLDVAVGNFAGENWLYQGGLAQGLTAAEGLYHRTGTTAGGSLAPAPETPTLNGSTTKDIEVGDLDRDGDPDLLLCNDAAQSNRLWLNALGVPDTHAPTFHFVTDQGDVAGAAPVVIHAQVRDNAGDKVVAFYDARLLYAVDSGPLTCVPMASQGGQQFRGVIPAIDGAIRYRVEVTDDAGNTGVSGTFGYLHSAAPAPPLWQLVDCGTPGLYGRPLLELSGPQTDGSPLTLVLRDARPAAPFLLWLAAPSAPVAALGGTVYTLPFLGQELLATDAGGMFYASTTWPPGLPAGLEHVWQCVVADASNPHGLVLSNAVLGTTP